MLRKFQVTSVLDGNYYFIVVPWIWISVVQVLAVVLLIPNCACWVFLLTLVFYLVFRYSLIKFVWDGSSHFTMSMHTPLPFIKQIPRLNNSFDVKDCCVVVWLSLKFIYSVVLVDEQVYLLSLYSLCYIYILCTSDVRIYKGDSAEIY